MKRALPKDWAPILMRARANENGPGLLFWIVSAFFLLGLNLYAPGEPTELERVLASLTIVVAIASIWFSMRRSEIEITFIPMFAIVFAITYGLGVFILTSEAYFGTSPMPILADAYNRILALSLAGFLLTIIGYYGPWWRQITPKLPAFRLCWRDARAVQLAACVFGAVSLIAFWISLRQNFPPGLRQPFAIVSNLFFLSVIALLILHLERRLSLFSIVFLYAVLLPVRVLIGMSQAHFSAAIVVAFAVLMTYSTLTHRIPWVFVVAGFAIFCTLQPVKKSFRNQVWVGGATNQEQAETDKLEALSETVQLGVLFTQTFGLKLALSMATERLSQLVMFVKVAEYTPSEVPYWGGESYYPFLFKLIPRAIYPEKPDETFGNEFGHRYAILASDDYATSINLPQLIEFYGNFGPWGVLIGSLLIGVLYRGIHNMFIHSDMGLGALTSGIFMLSAWLNFESNLSLVIGGIFGMLGSVAAFHIAVNLISRPNARL